MVGTAAATTLRSPCDIWWPNTVARVGHHLDRTFQVRDMETAWMTLSGSPSVSSLCSHMTLPRSRLGEAHPIPVPNLSLTKKFRSH